MVWLQSPVFVLKWVLVVCRGVYVCVCLQCFNIKNYFLILLLFNFEKKLTRERYSDFFSHEKPKCYMCTFFCHALKTKVLLAPARVGWSESNVTVPRSVSSPLKAFPDHTAPADTPFWFLHPLKLRPSLNTKNQVLRDAYFLWLPGQPSQIVISSTPSKIQDLPSILYPHTTPRKSTYKVRLC